MKKIILIFIFILSLAAPCFALLYNATDQFIITTYYPAPHGVYGTMRLYPIPKPKVTCNGGFEGSMYYNSSTDNIEVCKCTGTPCTWTILGGAGEWQLSGNNNLTNTNTGGNVNVTGSINTSGNMCSSSGCLNDLFKPCGMSRTTDWGANLFDCNGPNKRCYNWSCVTCGGWMNAGYCWYQGGASQSATDICSSRGGVYKGNCDWIDDPDNCSTCKNFHSGAVCNPNASFGPLYETSANQCLAHKDGDNDCTTNNSNYIRQAACNL
jgi:hypothetical protein